MQIKKLISIRENLQELLTRADSTAEQMNNVRRIGQLQAEQRQDEQSTNIRFPEGDPRLQQTSQLGKSRNLLASLKDVGRVICKEIKNDGIRSLTKHVEIYQLISNSALVEAFYGIAEVGGKRYAVMEDLQDNPTFATMIDSDELNGPLIRLHLAYEVASAVAYLHSVDIIIKNISDVNIVLKRLGLEDGRRFRPCLTNLEKARKVSRTDWTYSIYINRFHLLQIVESSSYASYDVRFESPEYRIRKRHSRNSDVWRRVAFL
jgi:serine/threonine protein kinase